MNGLRKENDTFYVPRGNRNHAIGELKCDVMTDTATARIINCAVLDGAGSVPLHLTIIVCHLPIYLVRKR